MWDQTLQLQGQLRNSSMRADGLRADRLKTTQQRVAFGPIQDGNSISQDNKVQGHGVCKDLQSQTERVLN